METNSTVKPSKKMDVAFVLRKQEQSSCREYDVLLNHLQDPNTETEVLVKHLRQLRDCVSLLTKTHEHLVGLILKLKWLDLGEAVSGEYKPLLLNLVSAHPYYLRACVRMLIRSLLPLQAPDPSKSSGEKTVVDQETRENDAARFGHVHQLLQAVAKIVPMTRTVVMELAKEAFPYHTRDVYCHEVFAHNLLALTHYVPGLRQQVLELLVDKMLKLDVRVPRRDLIEDGESSEEDEDDSDEEEQTQVFHMEGEEGDASKTDVKAEEEVVTTNHEEGMRLDVLMDLTFSHIHNLCLQDGSLQLEVTKEVYRELLSAFDNYILQTHASCHVQFLLFYICSLKENLLSGKVQGSLRGFVDHLWEKVVNPMTQSVFRVAAASYIGSLLARAAFVRLRVVQETLKTMSKWLHTYLDQTDSSAMHADLAHHAPFYAVCQALFYVFSFRSQQIMDTQKGMKMAEALNFQRLVSSHLNPLRICFPIVATTFSSVVRKYQLAFCDTIIQRNERMKSYLSEPTLEAYFPFDPYLLKRSGRWIKPLYKEYDGVLPDVYEGHSEEEEDSEAEDEMEVSFGTVVPEATASSLDFMQYGTSPGFKF